MLKKKKEKKYKTFFGMVPQDSQERKVKASIFYWKAKIMKTWQFYSIQISWPEGDRNWCTQIFYMYSE